MENVLILAPPGPRRELANSFSKRGFTPKVISRRRLHDAITGEKKEGEKLAGILLFEEGTNGSTLSLLRQYRRLARENGVPLVVVARELLAPEQHQRLRAGGASLVCLPDVTNERLVAEVEARVDLKDQSDASQQRAELLAPFIAATTEAAEIMANSLVKAKAVFRKTNYSMKGDASALVCLIGPVERILAITFPRGTAERLAEKVLGGIVKYFTEDMVLDCASEFVNIVAGQVMGTFTGTPFEFDISTPTLVTGPGHQIRHQRELPCFAVEMDGDIGPFTLQLCVRP